MFHELEVVKILKLLDAHRNYDGSQLVLRPPRIGDTGTIVFLHFDDGALSLCTVECVDSEGYTVWLADFLPEELQRTT